MRTSLRRRLRCGGCRSTSNPYICRLLAQTNLIQRDGLPISPKSSQPFSSRWPRCRKRRQSSRRSALAILEAFLLVRERSVPGLRRAHAGWLGALLAPILPLAAWYAYHFHRTGFVFGNPEYLRYNATANLDAHRIALCLYHRLLHLTMHMNLFVPVLCALAAFLLLPAIATRARLARPALNAIAVILIANWIAFSVLGGALLTRYLLPMYPLVLLVCGGGVAASRARLGMDRRAQRRGLSGRPVDQPALRLRAGGQPDLPRHDRAAPEGGGADRASDGRRRRC